MSSPPSSRKYLDTAPRSSRFLFPQGIPSIAPPPSQAKEQPLSARLKQYYVPPLPRSAEARFSSWIPGFHLPRVCSPGFRILLSSTFAPPSGPWQRDACFGLHDALLTIWPPSFRRPDAPLLVGFLHNKNFPSRRRGGQNAFSPLLADDFLREEFFNFAACPPLLKEFFFL